MMLGGLLLLVVMATGLLWLLRGDPSGDAKTPGPEDDWDRAELEQAERDVRDRNSMAKPDDEEPGDDWGPGAGGRAAGR
jgi:hypothetical protein